MHEWVNVIVILQSALSCHWLVKHGINAVRLVFRLGVSLPAMKGFDYLGSIADGCVLHVGIPVGALEPDALAPHLVIKETFVKSPPGALDKSVRSEVNRSRNRLAATE